MEQQEPKVERRGAKKGERRGGRSKGTLNKRTVLFETVREACERKGYSPAETLIEIASNRRNDAGVRGRAAAELCSYLYPKKRAVEVSGPGGSPLEHNLSIGDASSSALQRINSELSRLASSGNKDRDTRETLGE